jgi:hypothetical protein
LHVPRHLDEQVVLDNLSAHKSQPARDWLADPNYARWHLRWQPFVWTKTVDDIITKTKRGRATLTALTESATDH